MLIHHSRPGPCLGAVAAFAAAFVTGCASVGAPPDAPGLADAAALQAQPDGTRAWRTAEPGRHTAVEVDATAIGFGAGVRLDADERQMLRDDLRQALVDRLGAAGLRVTGPGDAGDAGDRLRLRATITAVERTRPALNAVTTVLLFAPLSYGGLSVEIEAFDAASGSRVAAMALAGRAGLRDFSDSFSDLGHARTQTLVVAGRFAQWLARPMAADAVLGAAPASPLR
ncbi:MAG: DUF3313 family protein [Burkholderiaceae bacterium]|nr:DUF3313 family protein [Burkholderiaceae bacterium]